MTGPIASFAANQDEARLAIDASYIPANLLEDIEQPIGRASICP